MALTATTTAAAAGTATVTASTIDQTTLIAPAAVVLQATPGAGFTLSTAPAGTPYEPWRHEITYQWTVRNSPLSFERAPYLNMPTEWKNANVYFGPEVVIVFGEPGTYSVDLVAVDRDGNYGTTSVENIVVADPDTTFSGTATIVVSDGADFTGAPSGATQINLATGSWADVNTAITARGNANTRVLLKSGVDFSSSLMTPGDQFDFGSVTSGNVTVGSFGSGAKPIIPLCPLTYSTAGAVFDLARDNGTGTARFHNLDLRGGWEADKERGWQGGPPVWRDCVMDQLFHRCLISGMEMVATQFRAGADSLFIWSDGEITSWQNFGIYQYVPAGGTKRLAVIGTDIHQHEDARQGRAKNGCHNDHGPLRIEQNKHLHLHCVDLFSRNGWSTGFSGTLSADQPCIRINSSGEADANTIGDRVVMEGGFQVFRATGQNSIAVGALDTDDIPGNHVFDKILTIGTPETLTHFECKYGGVTVRNGLAIEFNVPKYSSGIDNGLYMFDSDDTDIASNRSTPISTYNCTFVSLLSTANNRNLSGSALADIPGVFHSGEFTNYTEVNHIEYMPNQTTPETTNPVDITTPMSGGRFGVTAVTPRFKGTAESVASVAVNGSGTDTLTISYSTLLDKDGNTTSQSFWQTRESNGSTKHFVTWNGGGDRKFADLSEITVTFGASNATIQLASGTFPSGTGNINVRLDLSDTLTAPNATYDLTGFTVPTCTLTGTANVDSTPVAAYDFTTAIRPGSGLSGAPGGTAQKGAFE